MVSSYRHAFRKLEGIRYSSVDNSISDSKLTGHRCIVWLQLLLQLAIIDSNGPTPLHDFGIHHQSGNDSCMTLNSMNCKLTQPLGTVGTVELNGSARHHAGTL